MARVFRPFRPSDRNLPKIVGGTRIKVTRETWSTGKVVTIAEGPERALRQLPEFHLWAPVVPEPKPEPGLVVADMTAKELIAAVALLEDRGELEDILAAETGGKGRKTVIEALAARLEALE